jgi:diguanylate cyclase (GGDEF)-like protein
MIDIDFFKGYNDALGHDEGDICLQLVASTISKSSSRSGELVARFGGEEFIVLLPHCDEKNAYRSCENIRRSVEALGIKHPNSKVSSVVTVSIGCATCYLPDKTLDKKSLIKRADEALYRAKDNGRNRVDTIGENPFSEIKIMEDFKCK